jgi:hypothetical protein
LLVTAITLIACSLALRAVLATSMTAAPVTADAVTAGPVTAGPVPTSSIANPLDRSPVAVRDRTAASLLQLEALPLAAQTVISRVLGASEPGYGVDRTAHGLQLENTGISAGFTRGGVRISTPGGSLSLSLAAIGRGANREPVTAVTPSGHTNRVLYRGRSVNQSYVNGPLGLDQEFTIVRRPPGTDGQLTLALRLGGDLSPALIDGGRALAFRGTAGRTSLRYSGLRVTDAHGRTLPARLVLSQGRLLIRVADRGAAYPLRVDPTFTEITDPGDLNGDAFGYSVAISGDTIVVGAASDATNDAAGLLYVFTAGSHGWTQVAQLNPPSPIGEGGEMGYSVAISGSTIVAGAPYTSPQGTQSGEVFVFVEPPGGWASEDTRSPSPARA